MKNNKKTLGIIVVILGILILALAIYLFFFNTQQEPVENPVENNEPITGQLPSDEDGDENVVPDTTPNDQPRNYQQYDIDSEEEHAINENDLSKMAQAFAERFGSYSNYSNYSNFSDLKIFMTEKMKSWAEGYVADLRNSSEGADEYFGVTTVAISSQVEEYNEAQGEAVVNVFTRRRESTSQINEGEAYNQNIEIRMEKVNGDWLVDSAYWQ